MRRTNDGDVRTVGATGKDSAGGNSSTDNCGGGGYQKELKALTEDYRAAVIHLMCRTDGYLRCIPDGEQKQVYLKWKFTSGEHCGRYIMAVVSPWSIMEGHILLVDKLRRVYEGTYATSADKPYHTD